jgi:hypothetical protein
MSDLTNKTAEISAMSMTTSTTAFTSDELSLVAINPFPNRFLGYIEANVNNPDALVPKYIKQVLDQVVASGCNTVLLNTTYRQADAILNVIQKNEIPLKVILGLSYLNDSVEHCLQVLQHFGFIPYKYDPETYINYPYADRISGWQIMDQPDCWDWGQVYSEICNSNTDTESTSHKLNSLTLGYALVDALGRHRQNSNTSNDKSRLVLFNLCAISDLEEEVDPHTRNTIKRITGSSQTYREYVDAIDRLFKPEVLSYDFYPFIKYGGSSTLVVKSKEFFHYLSVFGNKINRLKTEDKKTVNFWAYAMVTHHSCKNTATGSTIWEQPSPTLGMLRFAAFNALAYGAKGIAYWRMGYSTSYSNGNETVSYHDAPIVCGIPGNGLPEPVLIMKHPTWDYIKTVNSEIQQMKSVFEGTTVIKCQHIPAYDSTNNCTYEGVTRPSTDEPYKYIGTEKAGVVVTHLQKKLSTGQMNYLLIVNKDYSNPQKISLYFYNTNEEIIHAITEDTPSKSVIENSNYARYNATLSEGGIIVFQWFRLKRIEVTKNDEFFAGVAE